MVANVVTFFSEGEFSGGQVSWATSKPRTRNLASRELQLEYNIFFLKEIIALFFSLFSMTLLGNTKRAYYRVVVF
jgi:hypothetical protein